LYTLTFHISITIFLLEVNGRYFLVQTEKQHNVTLNKAYEHSKAVQISDKNKLG